LTDDKKIKVLVLDDEASIRESLTDFLEDFNFSVRSAETAEDALNVISRDPCEVAIVDLRLPGMDGNSFILQANKICPKTRYIVHTGSVNYHLSAAVRAIGVSSDYVFLKPVPDLMHFVATIHKLLEE